MRQLLCRYRTVASVSAHADMRDGGPDRLAHTYQRELSQGVALERIGA